MYFRTHINKKNAYGVGKNKKSMTRGSVQCKQQKMRRDHFRTEKRTLCAKKEINNLICKEKKYIDSCVKKDIT